MSFDLDGYTGTVPLEEYSGLKLLVMGQNSVQNYVPGPDEVCISISSEPFVAVSDQFVDILRLQFDDMALADAFQHMGQDITSDQARTVAEFVLKHRDRKCLVIHCSAGVSRSRSMAAAIAHVLKLPYKFTVLNGWVYAMIGAAFMLILPPEEVSHMLGTGRTAYET